MPRALLRALNLCLALALAASLGACGDDKATAIMLDISIDETFKIPEDVDTMQIVARTEDGGESTGLLTWSDGSGNLRSSGTFGIKPGDKKDATVEVLAFLWRSSDNAVRAIKRVRAKFVSGKVVKVPLAFEAECKDLLCCTLGDLTPDPSDSPCFEDTTADCRTVTGGDMAMCLPTEECRDAKECDDGDASTTNTCVNGVCVFSGAESDAGEDDAADDAAAPAPDAG